MIPTPIRPVEVFCVEVSTIIEKRAIMPTEMIASAGRCTNVIFSLCPGCNLYDDYEEQEHEQEQWYQHQPDRSCRICHQVLSASAFGGYASRNGFTLYTRCKICHEAMLEQRSLPCCVCHKRTSRHHFLTQWKGYALCGNGAALSLCCRACESAFLALSDAQQSLAIRSCCQRAFPAGQAHGLRNEL